MTATLPARIPTAEDQRRAAIIQGLRDLATWLKRHPEIPLHTYSPAQISYHVLGASSDDAGRATVDHIAKTMRTTASDPRDCGQYEAVKTFTGGVSYKAIHCSEAGKDEHEALMSYAGRVDPSPIVPPTLDGEIVEPAALARLAGGSL